MKMIASVLSILAFASLAHALPAVGDRAVYTGKYAGATFTQTVTYTEFNSSTNQFHKVTTLQIGSGAAQSQDEMVNKADTFTDAQLTEIVQNCSIYGGTPQTVTVPAGTFPTCKAVTSDGQILNIAVVPFGIVRAEASVQGQTLVMELNAFSRGQ